MPSEGELVLRLVVSAALGGAVGLEREISDQPAGFRTHILVALGSSLFAAISAYGFEGFLGDQPQQVRFDPSRVAAQIVTGIGFLGAGAIIRYGMTVRGLTTAASLWVVAAIGLATALGAYLMAGVTTAITLAALWGLKGIRTRLVRGLKAEHEELVVETGPEMALEDLVREISAAHIRIDHLRAEEEDGARHVTMYVAIPAGTAPEQVVAMLARLPGIRNVGWTR